MNAYEISEAKYIAKIDDSKNVHILNPELIQDSAVRFALRNSYSKRFKLSMRKRLRK
jgi:hypothetical protein